MKTNRSTSSLFHYLPFCQTGWGRCPALMVTLLCGVFAAQLGAQPTAFTYQGQLTENGSPATGLYDLRFDIFDAVTNGNSLGTITNSATPVSNGLVTVTLDFSTNVFDGGDLWLEISARTNGAGGFTTLNPRQFISAAPYAIYSGGANAAGLTGTIQPANIATGSITSVMLADGAVTTDALADGAVTASKVEAIPGTGWPLFLTITNPALSSFDSFGQSITAVGGDKLVVGSPGFGNELGAAFLFDAGGALLGSITNPTPFGFTDFGQAVAAVGGSRLLVGAPGTVVSSQSRAGAAYLFDLNGNLLTTITNPAPSAHDNFGEAVAPVGEDKLLIGAGPDFQGGTYNAGAAYLYDLNGTRLMTIPNPSPANGDYFGQALVGVGADRLLIGAPMNGLSASGPGETYLFDINGGLLTTITNPAPTDDDFFGASVAVAGEDKLLVGSPGEDAAGSNAGAVYVFNTNGTLLTTIFHPEPDGLDRFFGRSIAAVGGDKLLVGASYNLSGSQSVGSAYLFDLAGNLLATFEKPTPSEGDTFGFAVAGMGEDRILISAIRDDTGGQDAGIAYMFTLESYTPDLIAQGVRAGGIDSLGLGENAVTTTKIVNGAVTTAKLADGGIITSKIADESITAVKIADGAISPADLNLAGFDTTFWRTGGNAGTTAGTHFLGTLDNQPLDLMVNGVRGFRLQDSGVGGAVNIIGGGANNSIVSGIGGATIAGGTDNVITGAGSTAATIGGGGSNTNNGFAATISGGQNNSAGGARSVIGGGLANIASGSGSVVGGGSGNEAGGLLSTIPGGVDNYAYNYAFAAGTRAKAIGIGSFVWADSTDADFATTGPDQFLIRASGGVGIGTTSPQAALHIDGADNNGTNATVRISAGGQYMLLDGNEIDTPVTALHLNGNVTNNVIIAQGGGNVGIGTSAPKGKLHVDGDYYGKGHVWLHAFSGDGTSGTAYLQARDMSGTSSIGLQLRSQNNGSIVDALYIAPGGNVTLSGEITTTAVNISSDRNVKEHFEPVSARDILDKVAQLPISEWQYKEQPGARHIGPMAQDFHAAFSTGHDDKHITTVDADGVALAAIQGLNEKVEDKSQNAEASIRKLEAENVELKQRLENLERLLADRLAGGAR